MTVLLADRLDEQRVIDLERQKWLHEVLIALGADAEIIEAGGLDAKDHLAAYELEVWETVNGTIDIHRKGRLVAQWKVPKIIVIKETPDKWYSEIHTNEWALPFQASRLPRVKISGLV